MSDRDRILRLAQGFYGESVGRNQFVADALRDAILPMPDLILNAPEVKNRGFALPEPDTDGALLGVPDERTRRACLAMSSAPSLVEGKVDEVCNLLKVVSNPNRLRILYRLAAGECSVAEMERELEIRQPTLSQQLGELRQAELVSTRREHKSVFYALADQRAIGLLAALHGIFCTEPKARPARRRRLLGGRRPVGAAMFALTGDAA